MGFWEGLTSAMDDIRHQVVEQPWFGRQTTGNIELPQVEAPAIEPASSGVIDLTSESTSPSWGVSLDTLAPTNEPPIEPVSWQAAAQDIEPIQQAEPPQPSLEIGG